MSKRPIVILTEDGERFYSSLFIEGESIAIHSIAHSEGIVNRDMDLLVLDCGQNPLKGLNLLKEIKTKRPDIPVVFLTEESSEDIVIKAFKTGAREFFKKPVDTEEFKKRLNQLLILKRRPKRKQDQLSIDEIERLIGPVKEDIPLNILKAVYFMSAHLGERVSMIDIAKEAGLSRFHFCRIFRRFMGMSPKKFLYKIRMERAKILLKNPEITVSQVADQVGFEDLSNFIRYFKRYTGHTPKSYRRPLPGFSLENSNE